jgi:serine/threonine protein kinase
MANIIISDNNHVVKWLDLGLSCLRVCEADDGVGSLITMAPEILTESMIGEGVNVLEWKKADVWSFGCVIYELLKGHTSPVQDDLTDSFLIDEIGQAYRHYLYNPQALTLDDVNYKEIVRLINICFTLDQTSRWEKWVQYISPAEILARKERLTR